MCECVSLEAAREEGLSVREMNLKSRGAELSHTVTDSMDCLVELLYSSAREDGKHGGVR